MNNELPLFKYHPYPLKTGNATEKQFVCLCCDRDQRYAYVGPVYSRHDIERGSICLGCIANGSAAERFDAQFTGYIDENESISKEALDELYKKTPGYVSWQEQIWLTHCGDICEFHGDFDSIELQKTYQDEENRFYLKKSLGCNDQELTEIVLGYDPIRSTQPSFYKFKCLICEKVLVHTDFT